MTNRNASFKTMKNDDEQPTYLRTLRPDFDPAPLRDCSNCLGHGYTIHTKGEYAIGKPCSCIPLCPRCGGVGTIKKIDEKGEERIGRCRCQKLPDRLRYLERAKIPARYGRYSFVEFDFERISHSATFLLSTWISHFNPNQAHGFILTGGVGQCKTHLMVATCKYLAFQYGLTFRFIEFSRLLSDLRDSFSRKEPITPLMEELIRVDILAIDEIGKGRCSDWELSVIDELISRRYNAMKILGNNHYPWGTATGRSISMLASEEFKQSLADVLDNAFFVFKRAQK